MHESRIPIPSKHLVCPLTPSTGGALSPIVKALCELDYEPSESVRAAHVSRSASSWGGRGPGGFSPMCTNLSAAWAGRRDSHRCRGQGGRTCRWKTWILLLSAPCTTKQCYVVRSNELDAVQILKRGGYFKTTICNLLALGDRTRCWNAFLQQGNLPTRVLVTTIFLPLRVPNKHTHIFTCAYSYHRTYTAMLSFPCLYPYGWLTVLLIPPRNIP